MSSLQITLYAIAFILLILFFYTLFFFNSPKDGMNKSKRKPIYALLKKYENNKGHITKRNMEKLYSDIKMVFIDKNGNLQANKMFCALKNCHEKEMKSNPTGNNTVNIGEIIKKMQAENTYIAVSSEFSPIFNRINSLIPSTFTDANILIENMNTLYNKVGILESNVVSSKKGYIVGVIGIIVGVIGIVVSILK